MDTLVLDIYGRELKDVSDILSNTVSEELERCMEIDNTVFHKKLVLKKASTTIQSFDL